MNTTTQSAINTDAIIQLEGIIPVYLHYDCQCNAQDAYLELDLDGTLTADSNAEIGNGVPADVWHGRTLRFNIPNNLTAKGIQDLVQDVKPLLERIHAGHDERWDGNNWIGTLTEDAKAASEELERELETSTNIYEEAQIWDAADWLQDEDVTSLGITATTTDEQLQEIADKITDDLETLTHLENLTRALERMRDEIDPDA